jgi:hypothetical protein
MPSNDTPLAERVASFYSQLSVVARDLNAASDEFGKSINEIDTALKKLNLGVSVWVEVRSKGINPTTGDFWQGADQLGYSKVSGRWGICVRTIGEDIQDPDHSSCEEWLFNDAPRALRLAAINKIPSLLEALLKAAAETKEKIQARLADVQAVAAVVKNPLPERGSYRGMTTSPNRVVGGKIEQKS